MSKWYDGRHSYIAPPHSPRPKKPHMGNPNPQIWGPRGEGVSPSQHEPTQHGRIPVLGVRGVGACVGVGVPVLGVAMSPPAHQPTTPPAHSCQYQLISTACILSIQFLSNLTTQNMFFQAPNFVVKGLPWNFTHWISAHGFRTRSPVQGFFDHGFPLMDLRGSSTCIRAHVFVDAIGQCALVFLWTFRQCSNYE